MEIVDFGLQDYGEILEQQRNLFSNLILAKRDGNPEKEYILIGEHRPVITMGRHAQSQNVLWPQLILKEKGIDIYHIERGGDVTYHCPGQVVIYPLLDLDKRGYGVKVFVGLLEEMIIELLSDLGITARRIDGAPGVWVGKAKEAERKICAIGLKCSRFCTMHGLSLNVNCDLSGFQMINPCGFTDKKVTSIESELGRKMEIEEIKEELLSRLHNYFIAKRL